MILDKGFQCVGPEKMAILVPWFNKRKYAEETLSSIFHLRGDRHLVLILDDCSTDGSAEFVRNQVAVDGKILWRQNERNLHIAKTCRRLVAWAWSLGFDIVGMLDCDDVIDPWCVEKVLDFYAIPPYKGMVYTQFRWCDPNLNYQGRGFAAPIPDGHSALDGKGGNVSHFRSFRLREYFKTDGFEEEVQQCTDKDLMFKIEEVCKLWFLDQELYSWRGWAEGSLTANDETRSITAGHHYLAEHRARERRKNFREDWIARRDAGQEVRKDQQHEC